MKLKVDNIKKNEVRLVTLLKKKIKDTNDHFQE